MKDLTPALLAHLRSGVTTICTCMEVVRRDGKSYRFTDHDDAVTVANAPYIPYHSFARTSISTTLDLEVDQMEIRGILNSAYIARDDVASGLFDFAEVRVFVVNYEQPDAGRAVLRVGWLGEVVMNEDGTFNAELRGLSQVYTYRIGEAYSPECRADLGDRRCKMPLAPARWQANNLYSRGDVVLGVINAATAYRNLSLVNPSFDDDGSVALTRITGWTTYGDPNCRWTTRADPFYNTQAQDSYALFNTDNGDRDSSDIGLFQDIDLEAQGVDHYEIDTGLCRLYATFKHACVNGREASTRIRIFAYDGDHVQIGAAALYDTGQQTTAEDRWFQTIVSDLIIPAGARYLRFDLFAHKRYRYEEGAAFDTITAAINSPNGTLGSADQFGDVAFIAQNTGRTGSTEPAFGNLIGSTYVDNEVTWKAVKSWKTTTHVDHVENGGRTVVPVYIFDAEGYYDGGLLKWETGLNAGRAQEIKSWAGGKLKLFQRPFHIPQNGDRFVLHPGCDKTRATCNTKFSNILNFRGEPDVPGQDKYYAGPNAPTQ
jgi:hypothetical protein